MRTEGLVPRMAKLDPQSRLSAPKFQNNFFSIPYFGEWSPRKRFFFETYGVTTIQGRKVFKGGNYCFCSQFNFKFAINMQQNNDETLESPAEKDYHRYLSIHWS